MKVFSSFWWIEVHGRHASIKGENAAITEHSLFNRINEIIVQLLHEVNIDEFIRMRAVDNIPNEIIK